MALKLPRYFYLLMEKPRVCYFQVPSPFYQVAQGNGKTPLPVSSRQKVRFEKPEKGQASTLSQIPPAFISLGQSQLILQ